MKTISKTTTQRGSALLIVLGFLSFMLISAVSFAVYMRIERQASSNYRHSVTGRHLLNASLYRAIDEIDAELRNEKVSGVDRPIKFPDWPGRTKPSAVGNGSENAQEARVLSLEALSFIPGIFVNDVRRYAVTNRADAVSGLSSQEKVSYLGTKWRKLSMPVASIAGGENAFEEAVVGRYAYVCVNLSDMLNVNVCKAAVRDGSTNRVGIGYLFGPNTDALRKTFDDNYRTLDKHYETLQDFYACMFARRDATFGSPYHEYLTAGNNANADAPFDDAVKHVLVTDGRVKAQPASANACNIFQQQPIAQSVLDAAQPLGTISMQSNFQTALGTALAGHLVTGANLTDCFPAMLADYLDEDSIPKQLNIPSVEMVPMISQIMASALMTPALKVTTDPNSPAAPATPVLIYSLDLIPFGPQATMLDVEVVWPFKNMSDRPPPPDYTVEILAYFKVNKVHSPQKSGDFNEQPSEANGYYKFTGTAIAPSFAGKNDNNQAECYKAKKVLLTAQGQTTIPIINSKGDILTPGFVKDKPISVSLIVFARVKLGNVYVDSAPQMLPFPRAGGLSDDLEFVATQNKIFFQTVASPPIEPDMAVPAGPNGRPLPYEWSNLEVPDPRFNYLASNWVKITPTAANAIPDGDFNSVKQELLGKEGRDGDIYMSVSNAGKLQSPGELGFIVRPFKYSLTGNSVDFRTQNTAAQSDDHDAMFRTIRIYDHGDPSDKKYREHDKIYENFTAQNLDGTVAGSRVNPLSDVTNVLVAAVEDTPVDYWFASQNAQTASTIMQRNTFNKKFNTTDWKNFMEAWTLCLMNVKRTAGINTALNIGLPDVYADMDKFGWYSGSDLGHGNDQKQVFTPSGYSVAGVPATLSNPLHEIDRKMLYSFSLDSFSDRQQLFLYILRAESTVPSFGGGQQEGGMKSLAGGRAVALVWRDPYPTGYEKTSGSFLQKDWYQVGNNRRLSPWYQVNVNRYEDTLEEASDVDPTMPPVGRSLGFHEHSILFFKQLDD